MSNISTPYTTPIAHRNNTEYVTPLPQTPNNTPHITPTPMHNVSSNIIHETPEQRLHVQNIPGAPKKPKTITALVDNTPIKYNN